jgi:hypothetical protein
MFLPGTKKNNYINGQENIISFKQIKLLIDDEIFIKPPFQNDLDENKLIEMISSYLENPSYLIYKNKIIVAVVNDKLYLLDGQHRLNMAYRLYTYHNIDDQLYICYFFVNTDNDMKKLFFEINKDSYKNHHYITLDDFKLNLYDLAKLYFEKNCKSFFSNKKNTNNHVYSITEFLQKIIENKYINKFNNLDDLIYDLENKNNIFYKLISYRDYIIENTNNFYVDEIECINNIFIISLKNNNFIDYICDNNITPDHKFKYKKQKISPKLRIEVWRKEFGICDEGKCPICTNNINIGKNGFHCSHIQSEINGGSTELNNLRPLCEHCNLKMGKKNWNNYFV